MRASFPIINFVVIFLGIGLHMYTLLSNFKPENGNFLVGLMLFSVLPYAICLILTLAKKALYWVSLGGALAALLIDSFTFYSVFISPKGSTASLALLFSPFWNLLLFMPIGMVAGYEIKKHKAL